MSSPEFDVNRRTRKGKSSKPNTPTDRLEEQINRANSGAQHYR